MIIKVCGMRDGENIRQVSELGVDWLGFIFWDKSPRHVSMIPTHAGIIPDKGADTLTAGTQGLAFKRVGVFVDDMPQNIITRVVNYRLDIVQLHGHETPTMIRNLRATLDPDIRPGIKFMKAISIAADSSVSRDNIAVLTAPYEDCVDYFLFDTQTPTAGGSGRHFDWSVLDNYQGTIPFLLSGGIGPDDVENVKNFRHSLCVGIDLNSRFETEPAVKDVDKLKTFINHLRNNE